MVAEEEKIFVLTILKDNISPHLQALEGSGDGVTSSCTHETKHHAG